MSEAVAQGAGSLSQGGPMKLRGATAGWGASGWDDAALAAEVGGVAVHMLVMPTETHPTLDAERGALTEPAKAGVFVSDFLTLTRPTSAAAPFSAYLAQMNLLALPRLLRQICLPAALPAATLQMANVWVGGELMKNGLHYDNYDNLLHQIRGRKRALLFPPEDTPHLYYGAASIHRHEFSLPAGVSNQTTFEKVRHNVAMVNVFADDVGITHPLVRRASPTVCELDEGDALFLPRGWHHAVISASPTERNLAVNLWYDLQVKDGSRVSSFDPMFQQEGCASARSRMDDSKVAAPSSLDT